MSTEEVRNAKIRKIDVSMRDWPTPILTVDFDGGGWGVGYPGYSGNLALHIEGVLKAAGASTLQGAIGQPVRVKFENNMFKSVLHFMDDKIEHNPREVAERLNAERDA